MRPSVAMHPDHLVIQKRKEDGDWKFTCSCGAFWTQQGNKTQAELDSIYLSHVGKFDNKTTVL